MKKLKRLKEILAGMDSILVAFSGGVDSSLLLRVAMEVKPDRVQALTFALDTFPPKELEEAKQLAFLLKVPHIILPISIIDLPEFCENSPERCYFCKKELFTQAQKAATEHGLTEIIEGTNADDQKDFRPGTRAIYELGIRSPLQEARLTKSEIRELSYGYQLPTWDRPSYACLASRFPYGVRITKEGLTRVAAGEEFLRELGFKQFRLRDHGSMARIEVEPDQFEDVLKDRQTIIAFLRKLGYQYICFDLEGYRTGSMNQLLGNYPPQPGVEPEEQRLFKNT